MARAGRLVWLTLALLLTGCGQPSPLARPWRAADQRAYDAVEGGPVDLIAVAARTWGQQVEIRWDLAQPYSPGAFTLELDLRQGAGRALHLRLPNAAPLPASLTEVRLWQDPSLGQAALHLVLPPGWLVATTHASLRLLDPVSGVPLDVLADFRLDGPPPPRVPLSLVFWNVFPAATPLQAMRAWDGAHRGPRGVRHGLGNLLRAARAAGAPLTLVGLDDPETRAALEMVDSRRLVAALRLSGRLRAPASWSGDVLAGDELPALAAAVATQAVAAHPPPLAVGGDLATSRWGEPETARRLLAFLTARPWIDLGAAGAVSPRPAAPAPLSDLTTIEQDLIAAWQHAPAPRQDCPTAEVCQLSSRETLALFTPGGALRAVVTLRQGRLHQLVGPTPQATSRPLDSLTWGQDTAAWGDPEGRRQFTLRLIPGGVRLQGDANQPPVSLALDPWRRFEPGWFDCYRLERAPASAAWVWQGTTEQLTLHLASAAPLTIVSFRDQAERLGRIEDPDAPIAPGSSLPIPLAQVSLPAPPAVVDLTLSVTAAGSWPSW